MWHSVLTTASSFFVFVYFGLYIVQAVIGPDRPYFFYPARFFVACTQFILHVTLTYVNPSRMTFHLLLTAAWFLITIVSYLLWRQAKLSRVSRDQAEHREEEPLPISPAARLDEIRQEKARLDLEERDLERRPDANRT